MSDQEQFDDIIDALLRPTPPPPSATLRVADLYSGDGRLGRAAEGAGFDVVYRSEPDSARGLLDFDDIPPFDIVTANMPDADNEREDALEFVLRFLRVRRPETFLMMGTGWATDGVVFTKLVKDKTRRLGYLVSKTVREGETRHGFIVGILGVGRVFIPPDDERPTTRGSRNTAGNQPALPMPSVVEQILRNLN